MASGAEDRVEDALTVLVNVTFKSGNLRNDFKKDIRRAVSNLRKEFANLKSEVEDKNKVIRGWEMKAKETNLKAEHGGVEHGGVVSTCRGAKGVTATDSDWNGAPSAGKTKRCLDVVADRQGTVSYYHKMYKLFVKYKHNQSAEYTRTLLKSKVNPTQIKSP
jgi:hypothetical protein